MRKTAPARRPAPAPPTRRRGRDHFDVCDIETDRRTERIGKAAKAHHDKRRIPARTDIQDRPEGQKANSDDQGQRRQRRPQRVAFATRGQIRMTPEGWRAGSPSLEANFCPLGRLLCTTQPGSSSTSSVSISGDHWDTNASICTPEHRSAGPRRRRLWRRVLQTASLAQGSNAPDRQRRPTR